MRMYHPELGREAVFPDDPDCIEVQKEAGWLEAPEEKRSSPAHEPEPVTYAPVDTTDDDEGKAKAGSKPTSATKAKS